MTWEIVWEFAKSFCVLFFVAFVFSRLNVVKKHLTVMPSRTREKVILSLLFGGLGCIGSGIGVEFHGSLINTRVIGVAVGGLIGGPAVGIASGVIAAAHRVFLVKSGAATAVVCGVSMIIEGAFAGFASRYTHRYAKLWPLATITVIVCELFRKLMLLAFIKPWSFAVLLVQNMTIPMLVINSIGVVLFVTFVENVASEQDAMRARQSQLALAMAERISTCFKQGIIGENQREVVKTVEENSDFSHVMIAGAGSLLISNRASETPDLSGCISELKEEMKSGFRSSSFTHGGIHFIATPLVDDGSVAGILLLGKDTVPSVYDWNLAEGLGKLFSSQITIGNLEYRANLLKEAEIKILQTQINPHFLFNTLTVIGSLCRSNPDKARRVIDNLAEFYRKNLRVNSRFVSLQDEIEHIEAYLEIIKARYTSKIDVRYDIDRQLDCRIPPLSLQPLVENSIKHGLLPRKEGGVISISARRDENLGMVRIEVEDNGKGFDAAGSPSSDSNHIGLDNVRKRLVSCFGEDLTWEISSIPDQGTKVTIGIPAPSSP